MFSYFLALLDNIFFLQSGFFQQMDFLWKYEKNRKQKPGLLDFTTDITFAFFWQISLLFNCFRYFELVSAYCDMVIQLLLHAKLLHYILSKLFDTDL